MPKIRPTAGISTLVNHAGEGGHPFHAHSMPLYQTSTFSFPDVATGASLFRGETDGYIYTRMGNPNASHTAEKIALLEALDLMRAQPERPTAELVGGRLFSSGMAAISATLLACFGDASGTILAQDAIYGATFNFLTEVAPRSGIRVEFLHELSPESWEQAFQAHPDARLAYVESPSNPTIALVDVAAVAEIAHRHGAWLVIDNTFASPYCQRPLTLGADVVIHSTTKYLSGHGMLIGGCVVSTHLDFMRGPLSQLLKLYGGSAAPFDAWLTNMGLKTFELRMQRHCANALTVARFLEEHPAIECVHYPGLESHPQHALAQRQMPTFGGMLSFELKGGLSAGISLMEKVQVCTLAVSLGTVDTLIEHPASMTHAAVSRDERLQAGITDGLVRLSVGIENVEDLLEDLERALE